MARLLDDAGALSRLPASMRQRASNVWTPKKLAVMDLDEILRRLTNLGVDGTAGAFHALQGQREEAWEIGRIWCAKTGRKLNKQDDDFICLAACELWKRYCPNQPSMEMLDDWMQDGYQLEMGEQSAAACGVWRKVWHGLRSKMSPLMRRVDDAEPLFRGSQCLFDWFQDFELALWNASQDMPALAEEGIELCTWFLGQFPDEEGLITENFRCELALYHFCLGRCKEAEQMLLDFIAENPRRPAGYANLSEALAYPFTGSGMEPDFDRAIALVEKALALPVDDPGSFDLEQRLAEMRKDARR